MNRVKLNLIVFIALSTSLFLFADVPKAVSTFHSIGLYWSTDCGSYNRETFVKFRKKGSIKWQDGYPMKYNPIGVTAKDLTDYRGSIVNLTSNTTYQIELTLEGTSVKDTVFAKTWSEDFPIAKTIKVESLDSQLIIFEGGTEGGYILYDGTGSTIDVGDSSDYCIYAPRNYVILRGFTLKNATQSAIFLKSCHNVIIENCDISGWGEQDKSGYGKNYQAGIFSVSPVLKSIVVQRCKIHNPRWDSNSWSEKNGDSYHPSGPQAIALYNSAGNHVFRYNTIWTDEEHMYNDIIGYGSNTGYVGSPNCDTDIYGNYLSNCWDDGIKADGADRNVRIWGNYIEKCLIPISNTPVTVGPLYVWKNVSGRTLKKYSAFIKMGYAGNISFMRGYSYIFNNTILQPHGYKGIGKENRVLMHCVIRNNILHVGSGKNSISTGSRNSDYNCDYDLCSGKYPSGQELHGKKGSSNYIDDAYFDSQNMTANFFLKSSSLGYDAGIVIPNFIDHYNGDAPDMGAFEAGDLPMEFGTNAYLVTDIDNSNSIGTVKPNRFFLLQNYPNPFNPTTTIQYSISMLETLHTMSSQVHLKVYNSLGQEVQELVNEVQTAGKYSVKFDGSNLVSGVYFYKLGLNNYVQIKKMLLVK
jgi:hypothetical protein